MGRQIKEGSYGNDKVIVQQCYSSACEDPPGEVRQPLYKRLGVEAARAESDVRDICKRFLACT
jgi:hypothetical protein